jgi:uncharacterized protein (DUF2147 family)
MKLFVFLLFAFILNTSFSQSCVGKWLTYDDDTHKKKSIVELYKKDGKLYGKVIYLYPKEGQDENPVCDECEDYRKGQPILGMIIAKDLVWDGGAWEDGTILDPEIGEIYTVKIWINKGDPNKLNVRGYIGPFFRTQNWTRIVD